MIVLDTCVIIDMIKRNSYNFKGYSIMHFQKEELGDLHKIFLDHGGHILEPLNNEDPSLKDLNFFFLESSTLLTYDRMLKRKLKNKVKVLHPKRYFMEHYE